MPPSDPISATPPKLITSSGFLPAQRAPLPAACQPHSIELPHPAIESLPEYAGRIESRDLQPAARHYNGSICRFGKNIFLAYRFETFNAVSKIGLCQLDQEFTVLRDKELNLPAEDAVHYEDPRLTVVGDRLLIQFCHVRLGVPPVCRQRMFVIGYLDHANFDDLGAKHEIHLPFGDLYAIEKNWSPFECPGGTIGLIYGQRPRTVLEVETRAGFPSVQAMMTPNNSSLSGRTPPLLIPGSGYLEFVGGHVPDSRRHARYWMGVQLFLAAAPFNVIRATREPLVWGTEASPTIFSPRPHAGHPCCIFPSGIMREGDDVIVSCGVNDSFIAFLRYNLSALFEKMEVVL